MDATLKLELLDASAWSTFLQRAGVGEATGTESDGLVGNSSDADADGSGDGGAVVPAARIVAPPR